MIAAVALIAADGQAIVDNGPDHNDRHQPRKGAAKSAVVKGLTAEGKVYLSLHAPKGELRGALLEEGSIVRVGPKEVERFRTLLQPGAHTAVRGDGIETPHGRVIEGKEIGHDLADLQPTKARKPPKMHQ